MENFEEFIPEVPQAALEELDGLAAGLQQFADSSLDIDTAFAEPNVDNGISGTHDDLDAVLEQTAA